VSSVRWWFQTSFTLVNCAYDHDQLYCSAGLAISRSGSDGSVARRAGRSPPLTAPPLPVPEPFVAQARLFLDNEV
jgi:hypothetical protein